MKDGLWRRQVQLRSNGKNVLNKGFISTFTKAEPL